MSNRTKCDKHDKEEDIGAIEWNDHVQRVLNIIPSPFSFLCAFLDLCNRLSGFHLQRAAKLRLLGVLTRLKVLLSSDEIVADGNLWTFIVKLLSLELVHDESFCEKWVRDLRPHML